MARQVEIELARHGDTTAGRTVETIVDKETGVIAQRERVAIAHGDQILIAEKIRAIQLPNWIQEGVQQRRDRAISFNRGRYDVESSQDTGGDSSEDSNECLMLLRLCCVCCFLPCIANKFCMVLLQCIVWAGIVALTVITALGPINCQDLFSSSIMIFVTMGIVILFSLMCACYACFGKEDQKSIQVCISFCACLCGLILIGVVIATTVLAAIGFSNGYDVVTEQCKFSGVVIGALTFSYALMAFFALCWCFCCCCLMSKSSE